MPHTMDHVSLLAIVAATIAAMVLGFVWFALLFERHYAAALGHADAPSTQTTPLYVVGPLLCVLLTTIASALLMSRQHVASLSEAAGFGAIVGIGYLSATAMNMAINPNIPRPILYGLLSSAYFLVSSLLVALVLYALT